MEVCGIIPYHSELCLFVRRNAEGDRQYPSDEDEGIVRSSLFGHEGASTEACDDRQAGNDGENDRNNIKHRLRGVSRDSRYLNGSLIRIHVCHVRGIRGKPALKPYAMTNRSEKDAHACSLTVPW